MLFKHLRATQIDLADHIWPPDLEFDTWSTALAANFIELKKYPFVNCYDG